MNCRKREHNPFKKAKKETKAEIKLPFMDWPACMTVASLLSLYGLSLSLCARACACARGGLSRNVAFSILMRRNAKAKSRVYSFQVKYNKCGIY